MRGFSRPRWLLALLAASTMIVPAAGLLAQTEPYSGGSVPATTLVTPTVLGTTVAQGEQLPNTGFESTWLVIVGLAALVVGLTIVWAMRRSGTDA